METQPIVLDKQKLYYQKNKEKINAYNRNYYNNIYYSIRRFKKYNKSLKTISNDVVIKQNVTVTF